MAELSSKPAVQNSFSSGSESSYTNTHTCLKFDAYDAIGSTLPQYFITCSCGSLLKLWTPPQVMIFTGV